MEIKRIKVATSAKNKSIRSFTNIKKYRKLIELLQYRGAMNSPTVDKKNLTVQL